ncbi:MAG: DedA family protein, partial [Candidatus Methylomirabilales bacterium]
FYLLIAGALTRTGNLNFLWVVLLGALGAFLGDHVTFYLGRRGGMGLIDLYCKYTLCSAQCSLKTESFFTRFGGVALLFGRFVVGVRTLACPLAGALGMPYRRFTAYDLLGALLWSVTFTAAGFLFSRQLHALVDGLARATHSIIPILLFIVALLIGYRYYRRWRYGPAEAALPALRGSASSGVSSSAE